MKYKYILFDLDGTLTDPKEGITKAIQYALLKYGIKIDDLESLTKFIGPPLKDAFMEHYGFEENKAIEAIEFYREYYREKGIFQNLLYPDIVNILETIKVQGGIIILATSKPTIFAEQILEYFNIKRLFSYVIGSNLDGTRGKKGDVIKYIIHNCNINNVKDAIMIGDRHYDINGARENNIDSIAVTFGYGSFSELNEAMPTYLAKDTVEILKYIL